MIAALREFAGYVLAHLGRRLYGCDNMAVLLREGSRGRPWMDRAGNEWIPARECECKRRVDVTEGAA